jgi:hypothetical protein
MTHTIKRGVVTPSQRERQRIDNAATAVALTLDAATNSFRLVGLTTQAAKTARQVLADAHPKTPAAQMVYQTMRAAAQAAQAADNAARAAHDALWASYDALVEIEGAQVGYPPR